MGAQAIDNSNLKNYRDDQGTTGFTPSVTFAYDAGAGEVDVTDGSTYPSGVALKKVKVAIHDKFGGEVRGVVEPAVGSGADTETINVSSLNATKGLDLRVTVLADDNKLVADGGAYGIGASGSVTIWDAQKNG